MSYVHKNGILIYKTTPVVVPRGARQASMPSHNTYIIATSSKLVKRLKKIFKKNGNICSYFYINIQTNV